MSLRQKHTFLVNAAGGLPWTDTGAPVMGEIRQARWIPTSTDTGNSTLEVLLMTVPNDTAAAVVVARETGALSSSFTRMWKQPAHTPAGVVQDTGGAGADFFTAAGESLRVKFTPSGATAVGKLVIWTG